MTAAIDLFGAVYTTQGGTRYHADAGCYALANGRDFHAARGGWDEGVACYALQRRSTISAVQFSYTACLVCVPAADALPPLPFVTGETFGHVPVDVYAGTPEGARGASHIVCARCIRWWRLALGGARIVRRASWPCTSALVLGVVAREATS